KAEIDTLGLGAAAAAPTHAPGPTDAATLKTDLTNAGVTLTLVGTETKNNVSASHIAAAIDVTKFLDSPMIPSAQKAQVDKLREAAKNATVTADLRVDSASKHLVEMDLHVVATGTTAGQADLTIG